MHGTDIGSPSYELEIEEPKKKRPGKREERNTKITQLE